MVECGTGGRFVADLFHHSQLNGRGLALLSIPFHSTRETKVARFAQAMAAAADGGGGVIGHGFCLFLCFISIFLRDHLGVWMTPCWISERAMLASQLIFVLFSTSYSPPLPLLFYLLCHRSIMRALSSYDCFL